MARVKRGTKRRARGRSISRGQKIFLTKSKLYQSAQERQIARIVMRSATGA